MRTYFALGALCAAVALSACQDPAGVGLGLIDQEGVDPNVRTIEATTIDTVGQSRTAIGFADPNSPSFQRRVLVGRAQDALFGDADAVAYLDAVQPSIDSDLEASDVTEVWLELRRNYVYGDTTATLPVTLSQIQGSWQADPTYSADTLFATGDVLTTTDVVVADSLARWTLPQNWVTANAATLLGGDFDTAFEGFALDVPEGTAPSPGVVFGFSTLGSDGSGLRVVVPDDTLFFPLAEVFTSIRRQPPTAAPASALPSRAFSEADARFAFDLSGIGALPLARATLTVPLDRSVVETGSFLRPLAPRSALYGIRGEGDDETRTLLGELQTTGDGDARVAASNTLTRLLQDALLDPTQSFDRFEITPGASLLTPLPPVSLDILPVLLPPTGTPTSRFTLTVIGQSS